MKNLKLNNDDHDDDSGISNDQRISVHLDWSDQQRRILTDNGNAELWYSADRGYPFTIDELPHFYLSNERQRQQQHTISTTPTTSTREIFQKWKLEQQQRDQASHVLVMHPIVGIWERTLFYGGFECTTNHSEYTYNIQTPTLFIDLRIPKSRDEILMSHPVNDVTPIQSLHDMNLDQLRYYARQHIFAGYTKVQRGNTNSNDRSTDRVSFPYSATRHHCLDWNYVGIPRSRPNKWYIELPLAHPDNCSKQDAENDPMVRNIQQWKEWAYATNQYQQHYYCEYWRRHQDTNDRAHDHTNHDNHNNTFLILRKCSDPDGIIIIWNDHIMYCIDRDPIDPIPSTQSSLSSLVAVVDELLLRHHDMDSARKYLSMQGGHGRWIASGADHDLDSDRHSRNCNNGSWMLDHCIEFWKQGQSLFGGNDEITMIGTSFEDCTMQWKQSSPSRTRSESLWSIFDTNLDSVESVRSFLIHGPNHLNHPESKPPLPVRYPKL